MSAYNTENLIAIFEDNDALSTDGYMHFCCSLNGSQYFKRDFLYKSGTWRGQYVASYFRDRNESTQILVLGHSDYPTRVHDLLLVRATGTRSVLATNCTPVQGLSRSLPLGLTNYCDDSPVHRILGLTSPFIEVLTKIATPSMFNNSVLMSFNAQTASTYRESVYSMFSDRADVTSIKLDYTIAGRLAYLQSIRKHSFVLCPRGNGRDTHRLWETLYLGAIPIVKRRDLPEDLLSDFPIWIVNSWSEALDPNARAIARDNLLRRDWDENRLRQSYWNSIIASHLK
jgi:hypothetical protein